MNTLLPSKGYGKIENILMFYALSFKKFNISFNSSMSVKFDGKMDYFVLESMKTFMISVKAGFLANPAK